MLFEGLHEVIQVGWLDYLLYFIFVIWVTLTLQKLENIIGLLFFIYGKSTVVLFQLLMSYCIIKLLAVQRRYSMDLLAVSLNVRNWSLLVYSFWVTQSKIKNMKYFRVLMKSTGFFSMSSSPISPLRIIILLLAGCEKDPFAKFLRLWRFCVKIRLFRYSELSWLSLELRK